MHIGEYIKYRRRSLGYTQQQLADRLSVSKQAVNKWEKCLSLPNIMLLPELGFVLKKSPYFLTEIIWRGNYEGKLTHFVFLSVTEKNGESYVIRTYEAKDFPTAADCFEEIRMGNNTNILQYLADFYDHDHSRTFNINLEEYEYSALEGIDDGGFLIDSRDITSLVADFSSHLKAEN